MPLTASTVTRTVSVDGASVTCHDSVTPGELDRPLVLVHGTGGTTASHFGHLFPMMATRTRVIAVDWAPTADPAADLTVDLLVGQVRAVVDELLGPDAAFDLLGYSLGAVVAGQLAADLGRRVENLVLVAGWATTDVHQRLRNEVWRHLYDTSPDALARYTAFCGLSPLALRSLTPAMLDGALASLTADEFTARQMDLNARVDVADRLSAVTARTLIVSCAEDIMVPPHHQYELLGIIDDARLTTMTSGHAFFLERPAELMQIVDLYLREPDRHPAGAIIPETHA